VVLSRWVEYTELQPLSMMATSVLWNSRSFTSLQLGSRLFVIKFIACMSRSCDDFTTSSTTALLCYTINSGLNSSVVRTTDRIRCQTTRLISGSSIGCIEINCGSTTANSSCSENIMSLYSSPRTDSDSSLEALPSLMAARPTNPPPVLPVALPVATSMD
jgi:hypothetical protein